MTAVDSAQRSRPQALDLGELATAVTAEVTGPRGRAPELSAVTESLRQRAAGEPYSSIAAAVGVTEKRAASWCRTAARLDKRFDAREAKVRKSTGASRTMLSARIEDDVIGLVHKRAHAEGRSVTSVVESALQSYVGRKVAGLETAVRRALRKNLRGELRDLAAAIGAARSELTKQGVNLNQLALFCNRYRELPGSITDELERTRQALDENRAAIEALHASVLARFETED
ncbi:hypothetical protein [Gordonia aquimaris]|uniref:Uncharacterized protein n=1 Tax=Gordonia aquimaris TaxID=2984863 RepID=A0A9X3D5U2_9ACTN|nr:hypothetical protein [Gordonia aquimaris]MCX2964177.1 hypothetical protein [Gordonia aquimaris]